MPNIAQQDYIIIDWEGKNSTDATKMSEVGGLLTNIYKANPLALLSVIFKNYDINVLEDSEFSPIISFKDDDGAEIQVRFYSSSEDSIFTIAFSLS